MFLSLLLIMAMDQPAEKINLSKFEIFSTEVDYIVNKDGVVAVLLDGNDKALLLIDAKGALIAQCGKAGQGPQEFQSPDSVWWDADASAFAVYDSENNRISRWDVKGKFISATPYQSRLKNPLKHDQSTLFFTHNERGIFEDAPAVMKVNPDKGEPQVFWEVTEGRYKLPNVKIQGYTMPVSTVWDPLLMYGLGSDFIAVSYTGQGDVKIFDLDGKSRGRITPELKQYDVTTEDIDQQIQGSFQIARDTLRSKRKELYEGKSWPKIRRVMVDGKDRIWVVGQPDRGQGNFPVHLYDAKGKLIKKTEIGHEPTYVSGDMMYYLKEDGEEVFLQRASI